MRRVPELGVPWGEPAGEAAPERHWKDWLINHPKHRKIKAFPMGGDFYRTIAAAERGSLYVAGIGKRQSPSPVDLHPHGRATAINDLTQALWLWSNHATKLGAAPWRWVGGVSWDIVQAWRHADDHTIAAWLSHGTCPQAGPEDHGQEDSLHPDRHGHWRRQPNSWKRAGNVWYGEWRDSGCPDGFVLCG